MRQHCCLPSALAVPVSHPPPATLPPHHPATLSPLPQGASGTMSFNHLAVALRCLKLVCEDGQLLVDLFANYDCDLNGSNLFERSIKALVSANSE